MPKGRSTTSAASWAGARKPAHAGTAGGRIAHDRRLDRLAGFSGRAVARVFGRVAARQDSRQIQSSSNIGIHRCSRSGWNRSGPRCPRFWSCWSPRSSQCVLRLLSVSRLLKKGTGVSPACPCCLCGWLRASPLLQQPAGRACRKADSPAASQTGRCGKAPPQAVPCFSGLALHWNLENPTGCLSGQKGTSKWNGIISSSNIGTSNWCA